MRMDWTGIEQFRVPPATRVRLREWRTQWDLPQELESLDRHGLKDQAAELVERRASEIASLQDVLWADGRRALLIVFQGMDTSGKDGTIKHVTAGMNPAGVRVISFKVPSDEERRHNYLWRYSRSLPEHGLIGIFNRSHYEEVTVVRVFPELLKPGPHRDEEIGDDFWKQRCQDINEMESLVSRSGTVILKFFLHLSREEQRKRLLERLEDPQKHWKFDASDLVARDRWDDYEHAYEEAISHTSTKHAPWWVVPADRKWAMRAIVAEVIWHTVRDLSLDYPAVDDAKRAEIRRALDTLTSGR